MRNVKVFVSSPGDLRPERQVIAEVLREFNERPTIRDRYKFSHYLYEDHAPAQAGEGPQDVVNTQMLEPHEADLVICMYWSRYGTPLEAINPDTGQPYGSGTEWEFYDAYRAYQRRKRPTILLYRKSTPPPLTADPAQIARVIAFFERFNGPQATLKGLYRTFDTPERMRKVINDDIEALIATWERPAYRLRQRITAALPLLLAMLIGLLVVVGALLAAVSEEPLVNAPFNIAFAGFTSAPDADIPASDVDVLTEAFHTNFATRLDEIRVDLPLVVSVWPPDRLDVVTGASADQRAASAAALVTRLRDRDNLRADIVVYGVVEMRGDQVAVVPEFYIAENWPELHEVFGRFQLTTALYATNIDRTRALSGDLSNRSQILASITQGVVQMVAHQYDDAYRAYDAALRAHRQDTGKELLYVLRGNAAISNYNRIAAGEPPGESRRLPALLDQAEADFEAAIQINDEYARAYAGLGSTKYLRALETVVVTQTWGDVSETTLADIEATYNLALTANDRPASADIEAKVTFGRAQLATLRVLAGDPAVYDQAMRGFDDVIASYAAGANPRLKELAAEAHARRGLLLAHQLDYDAARDAYQQAISLTELIERRRLFERRLQEVIIAEHTAARDYEAANDAYIRLLTTSLIPIDEAIARFNQGKLLREAGQLEDAVETYTLAVALDLDNYPALWAQLHVELGDSYYDLGRLADSITAYERALEIDPTGQAHLQRLIDETAAELDAATPTP
ncbi:MAG: tetratricopeptide repeat protein, partial [Chloroflexi bacterium]|nr:tetratricopeptide repeat protein [Chloroflexota bacterium]